MPKYRLTAEEPSKILDIYHAGEVDFAYMHTHTESTVVYHQCLSVFSGTGKMGSVK